MYIIITVNILVAKRVLKIWARLLRWKARESDIKKKIPSKETFINHIINRIDIKHHAIYLNCKSYEYQTEINVININFNLVAPVALHVCARFALFQFHSAMTDAKLTKLRKTELQGIFSNFCVLFFLLFCIFFVFRLFYFCLLIIYYSIHINILLSSFIFSTLFYFLFHFTF